MGLLDRVKQNQTVPPAGPAGNGPATATLPGAPTYTPQAPVAQPTAPAAPARTAMGGDLSPAFTAAKVQIHAKLIEKFADEIDSSNKSGVREKILELAEEYFRSTALTIRKFAKEKWGPADIVNRFRSSSPEIMTFLRSCVRARLNILVSGGTGSGKTTLLNILSTFIPETERLITAEDAAELQLQQPHWIQLESRPPNVEGKGAVPIRELVQTCLRMRPDQIGR